MAQGSRYAVPEASLLVYKLIAVGSQCWAEGGEDFGRSIQPDMEAHAAPFCKKKCFFAGPRGFHICLGDGRNCKPKS